MAAEWKVRTRSSTCARRARNSGARLVSRLALVVERNRHVGDHRPGVGAEDDDPLAEEDGLLDVVGDDDDGGTGVGPDPAGEYLHVLFGLHVEGAERFVEQEHRGFAGQRPGDGHPLPLTAGEVLRQGFAQRGESGLGQIPVDPLLTLHFGQSRQQFQPEGHVALHRPPRVHRALLEDQAPVRPGTGHRVAVEQHATLGRAGQPGDQTEQCGLSRTAGADDADQLAPAYGQVDPGKGPHSARIILGHPDAVPVPLARSSRLLALAHIRHAPLASCGGSPLASSRSLTSATHRSQAAVARPLASSRSLTSATHRSQAAVARPLASSRSLTRSTGRPGRG